MIETPIRADHWILVEYFDEISEVASEVGPIREGKRRLVLEEYRNEAEMNDRLIKLGEQYASRTDGAYSVVALPDIRNRIRKVKDELEYWKRRAQDIPVFIKQEVEERKGLFKRKGRPPKEAKK